MTAFKSKDGWEAQTDFPIDDTKILRVMTYKNDRGMSTYARIITISPQGYASFSSADYRKLIMTDNTARATEKSINLQHNIVVANVDEYLAEVAAFYKEKV